MKSSTLMIGLLCVAFFSGCARQGIADTSVPERGAAETEEIRVMSDGTKYLIHPSEIQSGGPPKDGIPSIDNPVFVSVREADEWIEDNELVLGIDYRGERRAYPAQIMVWHEIVNDTISGDPLLITWCPLCGTGIAYERSLDGKAVEFGTTGRLYNSNLVMYDRETETWWTQIGGTAILGPLTGGRLRAVTIDTVSWRAWKERYPLSLVLGRDTGYDRPYGRDPYGNYYVERGIMFPVENEDESVHPKTVIFGVEIEGAFKAYREDDLIAEGTIEDTVGGRRIRLVRDDAGLVSITDLGSGEEIVKERGFWFSWYAFHPETLLYGR